MFTIYLFLVLFYHPFPILLIFPAQSYNIYNILYDMLFEIYIYQPFNPFLLFFSCVDNTLTNVLMLRIILVVFVIVIFFIAFTFSIKSYRLVRAVLSLSVQ